MLDLSLGVDHLTGQQWASMSVTNLPRRDYSSPHAMHTASPKFIGLWAATLLGLLGAVALLAACATAANAVPMKVTIPDLPVVGRIDAVSGQVIAKVHVVNPVGPCIVVPAGVHHVIIRDSEIGPCGQNTKAIRDYGVFVLSGASDVTVERNLIHDVSSGMSAAGAKSPIVFDRNAIFNIRGPIWAGQIVQFSRVYPGTGRSRITCNVYDGLIDTPVAGPNYVNDHISMYESSGSEGDPIEIAYNRIRGASHGNYQSGSGMQLGDSRTTGDSSLKADAGGWIWAHDNTIVRTNGAGISVAGGSNILVERNRVENRGDDLASLTGWAFAAVAYVPGANITFRNNRGTARLWAFNHDGSPGDGLIQDKKRPFQTLIEQGNVYGAAAGLTPAIFDEEYAECK
jgi:hypothetical protein